VGPLELFSYADAVLSGPVDRLYREIAEQAELADGLGYGRLWLTEQHLGARGRVPDSLQMLAFLAARTTRLRLGTGVLPAAVHQPVLLIESVLQLNALSGGRLDLGIGSGSEAGGVLDVVGVPVDETVRRTAELYELLEQVRPGVPLRSAGRDLDLDPVPDRPLLGQVWTAAGRQALDLTARYGTGLLLPRPMPLEARRELARRYREAVPHGRVVHFKAGMVAPSAAEARRWAAPFVADYARRYLGFEAGGPDTTAFREAIDRLDFAVGEPAQVAEHMERWLDGFDRRDRIAIQLSGPGVAHGHTLRAMELLAGAFDASA
jgi:alkanesulfonate monooxygenase SsuD/methylene tetrahydromethanopterin reductase-like flavin-dependent oxidoreductase (luciferase family)